MKAMKSSLFFVLMLAACAAFGADILSVKPTSLEFGKVPVGRAKSLTLRLKTSSVLSVSLNVTVSAPYTVDRARFSLQKLSFSELIVTLPASAQMGEYNGKLIFQVTPIGLEGANSENIEVALTGEVVAASTQDFSVTASIKSCSKKGKTRSCTIDLLPSAAEAASVKTQIFESVDGGAETKALERALDYGHGGDLPSFQFDISTLSTNDRKLTLRIVIDPQNEIAEENEDNNESTLTLDIPSR